MKAWAKDFYFSSAWEKTRAAFLQSRSGLCERCLANGEIAPAKIVHHKIYLTSKNIGNPEIALAWDNLEALCQDCHNKEHNKTKSTRYKFDVNGRVLPPGQMK